MIFNLPLPSRTAVVNWFDDGVANATSLTAPAWLPLSPVRLMGPAGSTSKLINFNAPLPARTAVTNRVAEDRETAICVASPAC